MISPAKSELTYIPLFTLAALIKSYVKKFSLHNHLPFGTSLYGPIAGVLCEPIYRD